MMSVALITSVTSAPSRSPRRSAEALVIAATISCPPTSTTTSAMIVPSSTDRTVPPSWFRALISMLPPLLARGRRRRPGPPRVQRSQARSAHPDPDRPVGYAVEGSALLLDVGEGEAPELQLHHPPGSPPGQKVSVSHDAAWPRAWREPLLFMDPVAVPHHRWSPGTSWVKMPSLANASQQMFVFRQVRLAVATTDPSMARVASTWMPCLTVSHSVLVTGNTRST